MASNSYTNLSSRTKVVGVATGLAVIVLLAVYGLIRITGLVDSPLPGLLLVVALAISAFSLQQLLTSLRSAGECRMLGSLLISLTALVAVAYPGIQLLDGSRSSRLDLLGVRADVTHGTLLTAFALTTGCLVAFFAGELLMPRASRNQVRSSLYGRVKRFYLNTPKIRVYVALQVLGLATTLAFHGSQADTFSSRGAAHGAGLLVVFQRCVPMAVVLGILNRHWGKRSWALVSALSIGFSVSASGARSAAAICVVALGLRVVTAPGKKKDIGKRVAIVGLIAYLTMVALISISSWRGTIAAGEHASFPSIFVGNMRDPLRDLAIKGGLDTYDGMSLSVAANRSDVNAHWWDPAKAVVELVPYQLWPGKPTFLGPSVTHYYTAFGGNAGIFLSGVGYFYVVYGGAVGAIAAFLLIGMVAARTLRRTLDMSLVLGAYLVVRFFIAGDAFDAFYVLNNVVALALGVLVARASMRIWPEDSVAAPAKGVLRKSSPDALTTDAAGHLVPADS